AAPHRAGRRVPARVPRSGRSGRSGRGVSRSLRRALAVRFAATMGIGLVVAAAAAYAAALGPAAGMHRELVLVLAGVVVIGTGATLLGAWWLAGSAVRPVYEITEQATRIEAGTLGQRIVAHAETGEYRGLVAVLNRMLERIDAAFKNQRRLTADVSHELRSPLTALRGEIEVALRAERSPGDYQRVLRSSLEEIDRLTAAGWWSPPPPQGEACVSRSRTPARRWRTMKWLICSSRSTARTRPAPGGRGPGSGSRSPPR